LTYPFLPLKRASLRSRLPTDTPISVVKILMRSFYVTAFLNSRVRPELRSLEINVLSEDFVLNVKKPKESFHLQLRLPLSAKLLLRVKTSTSKSLVPSLKSSASTFSSNVSLQLKMSSRTLKFQKDKSTKLFLSVDLLVSPRFSK